MQSPPLRETGTRTRGTSGFKGEMPRQGAMPTSRACGARPSEGASQGEAALRGNAGVKRKHFQAGVRSPPLRGGAQDGWPSGDVPGVKPRHSHAGVRSPPLQGRYARGEPMVSLRGDGGAPPLRGSWGLGPIYGVPFFGREPPFGVLKILQRIPQRDKVLVFHRG